MANLVITDANSTQQFYDLDGAGTSGSPFTAKSPSLLGALTSTPATTPNDASASLNQLIRGLWQAIVNQGTPPTLNDYNTMGTAASGVIKNASGSLYLIAATNLNASSTRYLQLFNSTTAPAGGTTPLKSYPVYAGGGFLTLDLNHFGVAAASRGLFFATGIAWGMSTTALTFTAATAGETIVEARWL